MVHKGQPIPEFLQGGGETGQLIRAIDWSLTPLGPVDEWPQSLKTCIRIILTSSQPMFVWWGDQLINLYNDPYRSILGGKHPEALGQPASVVWHEIWDAAGSRAGRVMRENVGTYDEALLLIMERNGYPEETYYTFSYSPVPGDHGGTHGIICANTDETERIINERHIRTLKDIGNAILDNQSIEEVYEATMLALQKNPQDFPFAVLYQLDYEQQTATLVGNTDPASASTLAIPQVALQDNTPTAMLLREAWPSAGTATLTDLNGWFTGLPTGSWSQPPVKALLQPVLLSNTGQPLTVLIVGLNPYRLLDERYLGFFKLIADQIGTGITNVRAYEEERRRTEALMELDRAKTTFFSNISHEFRTPLTLMLGQLEELLNEPDSTLNFVERNRIESSHRNAMRLLRLVNSLLDFSRLEAKRTQARFFPTDLGQITADLASSFQSLVDQVGLQLHISCNLNGLDVYVDRDMWEKIVLNLLSNAFKYTLQGSISVSLTNEGEHIVLRVSDTGVGIPAGEIPRMFDRFHRIANSTGRTHEGTGIGLSLVHELVGLHHGMISVDSELGKGSTFTVKLLHGKNHLPPDQVSDIRDTQYESIIPDLFVKEALSLSDTSRIADSEPQPEMQPAVASSEKTTARVLIVDDNPDMRAYIRRLTMREFDVETAQNGQEALTIVQQHQPDLIVSDIMMPVLDGIGLLRALKNNPETAAIPVIFLSARAGEEARIEGYDIGADDYLVKPFSAKELLARIRSQIKLSRIRKQNSAHLQSLFLQAPVGIGLYRGRECRIELANDIMLRYWGRTREEVINKPLFDALPEVKGQPFEAIVKNVFDTGVPFIANEIPATLLNNGLLKTIYVKLIFTPLREEDGTISGIMGLAHDITDMVLARQQAQHSADELERKVQERTWEILRKNEELVIQKEFVETIFDASAHVIAVLDTELNFTAVNRKFEQLYKHDRNQVLGRGYLEVFPAARGSKAHQDSLDALAGHYRHNTITYSTVINGFFENYFIPLRKKDEIYGVLILSHDVTELVEATQKIERTNKELVQINHELEQFAYIASHDLQEPLRKIQTFADLLAFNLTDSEMAGHYLGKITSSAQRMAQLIKAVLDYSRLSKKDELFTEVDLNVILDHILIDLELLIEQKNVAIQRTVLPTVKGIPLQLSQLFTNLITNAIKFSDQTPAISVWAENVPLNELKQLNRLSPDRPFIKVMVQDNGIGFDAKYAEQIFTIFHRLHDRSTYVGTGIGLAMCKKIAENHKGTILATAQAGSGATFSVYLPL
ncbi:ATP-binding protein [Arsenicibacter rosenii]|uniref:histidine kinase n=1 Tax=Arsenicibacter rosenii TaxID=1750698 RepID=A0A1S2VKB0_9BACT|nr:ATP-binding protein [Arsenicibacter rosenii]OIN59184.1 hypothetical protein BLX24_09315 [Arsenicibacter rosenii]